VFVCLSYLLLAFVPIFSIVRWIKISENALDYSLMGTIRHALFLPRSWDVPERHFQEQHLPADGVYLDIGANSGLYSVLALSRLDQRGTLIALEPNPVMFRRLLVNIALNDPVARLRLHCCGVAERAGNFTLQLSSRNLGAARLGGDGQGAGRVRVVCRPLIDILRQDGVERVDVMKIDIEGYESRALNPFFASAPRSLWPRFINIESPQGVDWKALGYVVVQTTRQNTLLSLA
ncbi:MAG: FkbM family methyltransferase, partial [Xanthomonadales bacterium]|nr:FkbM family methyltransferase [Xanthomonadales bacterium]